MYISTIMCMFIYWNFPKFWTLVLLFYQMLNVNSNKNLILNKLYLCNNVYDSRSLISLFLTGVWRTNYSWRKVAADIVNWTWKYFELGTIFLIGVLLFKGADIEPFQAEIVVLYNEIL